MAKAGRNSGAFELSVSGREAVVVNLFGADRILKREAKRVVERARDAVFDEVQRIVPRDTEFMADHLRKRTSRGGLTFEVGWDVMDFVSEGLAFYPWFVEYGTVKMEAQPSLGPAYAKVRPQFRRDMNVALRGAIARISFGGAGRVIRAATSGGLR